MVVFIVNILISNINNEVFCNHCENQVYRLSSYLGEHSIVSKFEKRI